MSVRQKCVLTRFFEVNLGICFIALSLLTLFGAWKFFQIIWSDILDEVLGVVVPLLVTIIAVPCFASLSVILLLLGWEMAKGEL